VCTSATTLLALSALGGLRAGVRLPRDQSGQSGRLQPLPRLLELLELHIYLRHIYLRHFLLELSELNLFADAEVTTTCLFRPSRDATVETLLRPLRLVHDELKMQLVT